MVRGNHLTSSLTSVRTAASEIRHATIRLRERGCPDPAIDARRLMGAATGLSSAELISHGEYEPTEAELQRFDAFLTRRLAREPVSRIMGEREFYGRTFKISPATLDPRPETETLIDAALEIIEQNGWKDQPIRVLDVGTGSGCLIVTLLAGLRNATGLATDVSQEALIVAQQNAQKHKVADRVEFAKVRTLTGIEPAFHMIVSNPPYIPSKDIRQLDPEVRDYDPQLALDGGRDGLDIYRELATEAARVAQAGWVLVEVGASQAPSVGEIFANAGLKESRGYMDLGGHTRCVAARTQA